MKQIVIPLGVAGRFAFLVPLFIATMISGCQLATSLGTPRVAGSPSMPPDYNMAEGQFSSADFNKLGSEFMDEYVGQYVVFEGSYFNHKQGAIITSRSGPRSAPDMMSATIGAPFRNGSLASPRTVTVHWAVDDRELGRPFLDIPQGAPVKIYGYVLPAQTMAQLESRRDKMMGGFPAPLVLLIKARHLASS